MTKPSFGALFLILLFALSFTTSSVAQNVNFVMLYHSSWGDSRMIDSTFFNRNAGLVTHIIHFKIDPQRTSPYFSFDGGPENHAKNRQQIIDDAHARGMKVVLCIGGVANGAHEWNFITRDSALTQTVVNAMSNYARTYGYDGLDLDWESELTLSGFNLLSRILRRTLDSWSPRGLLTAAIGRGWDPLQDVTTLNSLYDYINIMAYDCNAYWSGTTGFHEPLYNPIPNYPNYDPASAALNIHNQSNTWVLHGLDKTKSSLGLALYGWAWNGGVTAPGQTFTWIPNLAGYYNYFDATSQLDSGYGVRHYDSLAHQPWITNPGGVGRKPSYVNYQDAQSISAKMDYLKANGWGGVMLFANEHATDLSKPVNDRWPLLAAVRNNLTPPTPTTPSFTTHPENRNIQVGASATFTVSISGYPTPSLRWQRDGVEISGATGSAYTLPGAALVDNGATFRCIASNSLGTVTSNTAILTVTGSSLNPPSVTSQPSSQSVMVGAQATFAISVSGNPTPSLQWQKNGVDISGANGNAYTTPAATIGDNGTSFRCIAVNSLGTLTSNAAILTVTASNLTPPSVTGHPSNRNVLVGEQATFSISVAGNPSPSLQWQKNGADISGATSDTYTTPATTLGDNGTTFRCVASNSQGTTPSNAALLTVSTPAIANPISDDFSNRTRFSTIWQMSNQNITNLVEQGTHNAMLQFNLDATTHDLWINSYGAPRVMQDITNGNFDVVAKFQSIPASAYQMQGIVVKENDNSWMRFDILRDNAGLKIFSGYVSNSFEDSKINTLINVSGSVIWLRVTRSGNSWGVSFSTDNSSYIQAGQFNHVFMVDSIGVFAGNSGNPAPPFVCNVDYFFNASSPIDPEDPANLPSAIFTPSRDSLPVGGGTVVLTWSTTDALSASINQGIGPVALNGSLTVTVSQTKTFILTVTNALGSQEYPREIRVAQPNIGVNPNDISLAGTPVALVMNATGAGSKTLETMRDGISPPIGTTNPADQYDSYNGNTDRAFDWVGYTYPSSYTFAALEFQEGLHAAGGGYFSGDPKVEVRVGEQWTEARGLSITPVYEAGAAPHYQIYRLAFDSTTGDGIRIAGTPGGSNKYISVAELRVIGVSAPPAPREAMPRLFDLTQNYPNPFNPTTTFNLLIASTSHVRVSIVDVLGQNVRTLADRTMEQGRWPLTWDGRDNDGSLLSSGVYLCLLETSGYIATRKIILAK